MPDPPLRAERLDHVPLRRAVVRVGAHVLKSYGRDGKLAEAALGLRTVQGLRTAATAPLEAVLPDLRVTVQGALAGELPADPMTAAGPAGEILREVQTLPSAGLPRRPVARELESHLVAVRIVRDILPELESRAAGVQRRLAESAPEDSPPVVAHGDFDDGQMLLGPEGAGVFDFDAICATHPAMDIARFAAVIVRREPARLDRAEAALAKLLDSYGEVPPDLDWWLAAQILCQVGSPFRKAWPDWPEKVEGIVAAAETVLDRGRAGAAVCGRSKRRRGDGRAGQRLGRRAPGDDHERLPAALGDLRDERAAGARAGRRARGGVRDQARRRRRTAPGERAPARARPCAAAGRPRRAGRGRAGAPRRPRR